MLIVGLMRNSAWLPKKTISRYFIALLFLLIKLVATAQQKPVFSRDSLFIKNADTTVNGYTETRPYYIMAWVNVKPANIKIIRNLEERTAIIEVGSRAEFNLLQKQSRIAPATNHWK